MIKKILLQQREYFLSNQTLSIEFRKNALKKLKASMFVYKQDLIDAFAKDYNKCKFDVIGTEFCMVTSEIDYMLKNLNKLSKVKKVRTSLLNFPSKGRILPQPLGIVLIMSPWNYPLQLSLSPLVGAIAAGNTSVVKPSNYCPNVANVIAKILQVFDEKYIATVIGGREKNSELLEQKFDLIFFTGGESVGKLVMKKAAENLTPVCLELGGKTPCIVDKTADLLLAAKRIVWGKFLNAGQTCVSPDFLYVDKEIKDELCKNILMWIKKFYYPNGKLNSDFTHIINDKHVERLQNLIDPNKVLCGGVVQGRAFEPTIMDNVNWNDTIMQEEIFGPILPILTYDNLQNAVNKIRNMSKPLALYFFSQNKQNIQYILNNCHFGGGCINDTVMHLTNDKLPFGGVGESGIGSYHGKKSFETFSHFKSIFIKGKLEINIKFPPYNEKKFNLVTMFTKTRDKK